MAAILKTVKSRYLCNLLTEVAKVEAVWYGGMDGYSEADEYGISKIWRQIRSDQKKGGVHRISSQGFEQREWW